jgi:hypothetical protein
MGPAKVMARPYANRPHPGREPKVAGEEGLKVHRLIDALIETSGCGAPACVEGA